MVKSLGRLATPAWRQELSANIAEEALEQIAEGFARQVDPSDRPWKKSGRASRVGGQTLSKSGRLRRSFSRGVVAKPSGFTIGTNVLYAKTHQDGKTIRPKTAKALRFKVGGAWVTAAKVKIPRRRMVPAGKLPPRWERALREAAEDFIMETLT
jgi:phage gpG-like protein